MRLRQSQAGLALFPTIQPSPPTPIPRVPGPFVPVDLSIPLSARNNFHRQQASILFQRDMALLTPPPPVGNRIKTAPSPIGFQLDYNSSMSTQQGWMSTLKSRVPGTTVFELQLPWALLENPALVGGAAQYDGSWAAGDQSMINNQRGTKLVDTFLTTAASLGCYLAVNVRGLGGHSNGGDVTNFPTGWAPSYFQNSAYGTVSPTVNGLWGALWTNSYGGPNSGGSGNGVQFTYYTRWWDTRVTALISNLSAAYAARYDTAHPLASKFLQWGFAADEMIVSPATGYTDAGAINALPPLYAAMRGQWTRTQIRVWYNYFQAQSAMDTLLTAAYNNFLTVGGPDTANEAPVTSSDPYQNSNGIFRSITADYRARGFTAALGNGGVRDNSIPDYIGQGLNWACEVEGEDLTYDCITKAAIGGDGRFIGDGIMRHIVDHANLQLATNMYWYYPNNGAGPDRNRVNTASPNQFDFLNSLALGGNTAVNGVTAGVALQNTAYPASWPQ